MKKLLTSLLLVPLLALSMVLTPFAAYAQQTLPIYQGPVNPGADLIQVIPAGQPTNGAQYLSIGQVINGSAPNGASGLNASGRPLTEFKTGAGIPMTASAAAGVFGVSITAGTSEKLLGEAALSNTKTDVTGLEVVLGPSYVAGSNITVTVNTNYTLGSGTIGTHTLAGAAYLTTSAGVQGSSLIATAAQSVPATAGTVAFVITGTTLTAGARLWITLTMVIQDTGGSNITGQINSVSLG